MDTPVYAEKLINLVDLTSYIVHLKLVTSCMQGQIDLVLVDPPGIEVWSKTPLPCILVHIAKISTQNWLSLSVSQRNKSR